MFDKWRRVPVVSAVDLRAHLKTQLNDLIPWDEKWSGPRIRPETLLGDTPLPEHERFWAVIAAAEERERRSRVHGSAKEYIRECFRPGNKAPDGFVWPLEWNGHATRLLLVRDEIRRNAGQHLRRESRRMEAVWEDGHAECPLLDYEPSWEREHECGLTNFVHADGVREKWVQEAIALLRERQMTGTEAEAKRARDILEAAGEMLWKIGSGDESDRTPEERAADRKRRDREHAALRTLRRRFGKWFAEYDGDRAKSYWEAVGGSDPEGSLADLPEDGRERVRWTFAMWAQKVTAREVAISARSARRK